MISSSTAERIDHSNKQKINGRIISNTEQKQLLFHKIQFFRIKAL